MNAEQLTQLAEKLAHERSFARRTVESLGDGGWAAPIPAAWQTAGFVQELLKTSLEDMERDPPRSLRLAQLAVTVCGTMKEDAYPVTVHRQLEGSAWLQVARSHRMMSQYDAALRALDRAETRFAATAALGHDLAVVLLQRAIIFGEMRRFDDSMPILDEVMPVLESFGDERRLRHAQIVKAMNYSKTSQYERACEIYEQLLLNNWDQEEATLALLLNNLGVARWHLREMDAAKAAFSRSRAIADRRGMRTEVTRADWNIAAKPLMGTGRWQEAIPLLQRVREEFLAHSLPEEAGLCSLDLVECYLATGRTEAAVELTTTVINEFVAARLNERAMTALAYLRDLLPDKTAANQAVKHVRSYIARLKEEPNLLFLPLPE